MCNFVWLLRVIWTIFSFALWWYSVRVLHFRGDFRVDWVFSFLGGKWCSCYFFSISLLGFGVRVCGKLELFSLWSEETLVGWLFIDVVWYPSSWPFWRSSTMACLKLGSRADVFRKQGQDWYEQQLAFPQHVSLSGLICIISSAFYLFSLNDSSTTIMQCSIALFVGMVSSIIISP